MQGDAKWCAGYLTACSMVEGKMSWCVSVSESGELMFVPPQPCDVPSMRKTGTDDGSLMKACTEMDSEPQHPTISGALTLVRPSLM